ncbi:glycosyltransferase [Anaerolinea thermolimosa]|uniref:glycosyltransferase family 4 protein n=1 Tax=Anaerolinea thermolimosa TaxID=229919 RepID=UPI000A043125|nr:glycosyltransferase family 4 protein [Anaerolinea thermolimosa]GAP07537.1 glycosyltransferase [Anaerolinea thermolimosa]
MKILLVANTDWFLYNYRLNFARFLREQGHEVALVSPNGQYASALQGAGFRWVCWEVGRQSLTPWKELGALLRLVKIYREERPDVVNHLTIKPVLYGGFAAKLVGVPRVVSNITGRGYVLVSEERKARLLRPLVLTLYRFILQSARQQALFENDSDRNFFIKQGLIRPERAHLLTGLGVDIERFHPVVHNHKVPLVLFAGRFLREKGVEELVEAGKILRQRGVSFRLVLTGDVDPGNPLSLEQETVQTWVNTGLAEWWGFQSKMEDIYAQADVFVFPSFYGEGLPSALMEAAACGLPIVASDLPGCRAAVEDGVNGFIVPVRDVESLANRLEDLLRSEDLRREMGTASRQIALQRFNQNAVNRQILAVMEGEEG